MKKLLALVACLSLLLSCCIVGIGATASAATYEASPEADFIAFDGVLEEYVGPGGDVVIPAEINGEAIREIAANAFANNTDISTVVIPEGVEKIGHRAFFNCSNLYAVEFPYSLYEFGSETFTGCGLEKVTVPGGVRCVAYNTFGGNKALKEINISYGVEEIHSNGFGQTFPSRVVFPETVTRIAAAAFNYVQTQDRVEFIICNPDLDLGHTVTDGGLWKEMMNGQWSDKVFRPWNSSVGSGTTVFKVVVPEGSKIAEWVKDWKNNGLLEVGKEAGAVKNSYQVKEESKEYFEELKENQKDWGIVKTRTDIPSVNSPSGGSSTPGDTNEPGDSNEPGEENDGQSGSKKPGTSNNKNNNNDGTTTTIEDGGDNTTLYIILGVVGVVFVLIIAGVVVFAIVMLKGGKKAAPAPVVVAPEEVEAAEAVAEEAPVDETPTEE